ncbi:MAG: hypothetical protein LQ349_003834 [Xanthoria aureola]|nr:MAG: hypothetical protein LQ349_003834 [Xanthoria aureola]
MKVNGFRIEVGEVEHTIGSSNGITAAIINKAHIDVTDTEVLIAYVTIPMADSMKAGGPLLCTTELMNVIIGEACARDQDILLPYMRPQFYLPLKEIPLTPNGSNFSGLGGESLAAISLASLCREIGVELEIADILHKPSLEQMALYVEIKRGYISLTAAARRIMD